MWSLEIERNWVISVTQSPSVEPCSLNLIEGNDPESRGSASSATDQVSRGYSTHDRGSAHGSAIRINTCRRGVYLAESDGKLVAYPSPINLHTGLEMSAAYLISLTTDASDRVPLLTPLIYHEQRRGEVLHCSAAKIERRLRVRLMVDLRKWNKMSEGGKKKHIEKRGTLANNAEI